MFKHFKTYFVSIILFIFTFLTPVSGEIVNNIKIEGNNRIADETILMFSNINLGDDLNEIQINNTLKRIYDTNFFKNVSLELKNNLLIISVSENPIIENITYNGIKSNTIKEKITENLKLKPRTSYNEITLNKDKQNILSSLKNLGYYFALVDINLTELEDNKVNLDYEISLGDKAKIKKISFIGNKIYKDSKLKNLIISEEYKFWKFISGKKYLNEDIINFDKKLLRNFYLNKGFYDVKINSSFARLVDDKEFELVFSIDANKKYFFGKLNLDLPIDYEVSNFQNINKLFKELENEPYSINSVEKIINEIDKIAINEQYESIKATINENIVDSKINLTFNIKEIDKFFVEKINIFGNNITRESVIRNQFVIDEGDPYNEILINKTENEIKSLNFFKNVTTEVIEGTKDKSKIINISVEEKPTGEIMAGAGFGTSGSLIEFGIKENNYLGKGLALETNISMGSNRVEGEFNIKNPNFNNTDKMVNFGLRARETDNLTKNGFKSKKIGGLIGTSFEFLEDFRLGLQTSSFIENIETGSKASARKQKQKGDYFDTYLKFDFDYDKRNQKFKTTDGYRSYYSVDLPVVSDNNTLTNFYNYKIFSELYENNISSASLSLSAAKSITGDDIKLSERLYIPSRKLRGFVSGKVGPKDGADYIGGNYYAILNLSSTLPQILPNYQNVDVATFFDLANVWGVDDPSLDDSNKIRSSIGIGVDWYTVVGPLSFSFSQPLTKNSNDKTETFRFNLGTTF